MTSTNRQFDQLAEAQEAQRQRMVRAANRGGISPPEPPLGSLGDPSYYVEAEPPETQKLDGLVVGRSPDEESAWRQVYMDPKAVARRDVERQALDELDELRLQALERDAVEVPRLSGEPVRPDRSWRAGLP